MNVYSAVYVLNTAIRPYGVRYVDVTKQALFAVEKNATQLAEIRGMPASLFLENTLILNALRIDTLKRP